ncbi:hypothetical protein [Sphingomicrobium clamense]|uniref:Uncharacterized protein n=1 Tax=Sphingomicrobium clamense TaxID=2851013 RepID=A0ABS6V456_9SPHN|nr:hypothetical protein [Sphingomicrobium sp. B8]MBW0144327.1 hypothetical protein [Sphingomicrobium sp. B8]
MLPTLYWTLLFSITLYAFLKGTGEHKLAAAGCVAATVATRLLVSPDATKYSSMEFGVLAVDVMLFGLFLFIALRSQRFWPLWIAGFHLVTVSAHAIRALKMDLIPTAYALAVQFWSYPVLLCIGIAVWRSQRRELRAMVEGDEAPPPAAA